MNAGCGYSDESVGEGGSISQSTEEEKEKKPMRRFSITSLRIATDLASPTVAHVTPRMNSRVHAVAFRAMSQSTMHRSTGDLCSTSSSGSRKMPQKDTSEAEEVNAELLSKLTAFQARIGFDFAEKQQLLALQHALTHKSFAAEKGQAAEETVSAKYNLLGKERRMFAVTA